jgi:hypothetical protein
MAEEQSAQLYRTYGDPRLEELMGSERIWALDAEEQRWSYPRRTRELDLLPFLKGRPTRQHAALAAPVAHGHFYEQHGGRQVQLAGLALQLIPSPRAAVAWLANEAIPLAEVPHPWIGQSVLLGVPDRYTEPIARAVGALLPVLFPYPLLDIEVHIIHGFYHPVCSPDYAFHKAADSILRHLSAQIARENALRVVRATGA